MVTVRSADGTTIAVARAGSGRPLVLLSGANGDHTAWAAVTPLLAADFAVYALDRCGRGASGDRADATVADELADVHAVLAAIDGPAAVVGHSSGAVLALRTAAREPGVRAVVAYEPPPPPPGGRIVSDRLRELAAAGDRDGAAQTFLREAVGLPDPLVQHQRNDPQWTERLVFAPTLAYDAAIVETGLPADEAVAVPATFLLGGDSAPRMSEHVRGLAGRVPGAQVRVLAGQQHLAMTEAPELVAAAVHAALG